MGAIATQITSLKIVYSTVYSDADKKKKTSKLRVTGLCAGNIPGTGEFPTQRPVTRKMFQFDDVIMIGEIFPKLSAPSFAIHGRCSPTPMI